MPNIHNKGDVTATAEKYGHGDYRTYSAGCRCFSCREASNAYSRTRNNSKRSFGVIVNVAGDALAARIAAQNMSIRDFAGLIGMSHGAMYKIINNGRCGFYTLDRLAIALDCHPLDFLAEPEYVYGEVTACHG